MPPETTSNVAGGLWEPASLFDHPRVTPEFQRQFLAASRTAWRRYQSLAGDYYGVRYVTSNYCFLYSGKGVASIIGGGLGALLFEWFGSWSAAFYGSAVLALSRTVTVAFPDNGVGSGLTSMTATPRDKAMSGRPAAGACLRAPCTLRSSPRRWARCGRCRRTCRRGIHT